MMNREPSSNYGISDVSESGEIAAPLLDYLPPKPQNYRPPIGLIGAGGITEHHLLAYQALGLDVVAICDVDRRRADERRKTFFPDAAVETDYRRILARNDVEVVDIATHPEPRLKIIEATIEAGKHLLSQKPFVTDLNNGKRLVDLADRRGVALAVNQNGRWAPHFSYMRQAVKSGLLGPISSIDFCLQWDHTWTADTPFNEIHHLILYDFGIHWFDIATALMGGIQAESVFAAVRSTSYQKAKPPYLAHAAIDYPNAQVRMNFNAHASLGQEDRTVVVGRDATIRAFGPGLNEQNVELWTAEGHASPKLSGCWFDSGFQGTMGELLVSIEERREPENSARNNLQSLQLCFAAIASSNQGRPVDPGNVHRIDL